MPFYLSYGSEAGFYPQEYYKDPLPRTFYTYEGEILEGDPCARCDFRVECLTVMENDVPPCSKDDYGFECWIEIPDDEDPWELLEKLNHPGKYPDFEEKFWETHRKIFPYWTA